MEYFRLKTAEKENQIIDLEDDYELTHNAPSLAKKNEPSSSNNTILDVMLRRLDNIDANQETLRLQNEELKEKSDRLEKQLTISISLLTRSTFGPSTPSTRNCNFQTPQPT